MKRPERDISRLIRGAMGEIKADLVITGGELVNVYSGEILKGMEIAVLDGRICYVGPKAAHAIGPSTRHIGAGGLVIAPGFIDAHTHIGHFCRPFEYLQAYLPHGTTSLVASCDELQTVFGFRGLKIFLDEVEPHPARVFTLISMVAPQDPLLCSTAALSAAEIAEALRDPRVFGMGEIVAWMRLSEADAKLLEKIEIARRAGKIIHGHTAGARDQRLCAVAAAGVSSCHEPIRAEDALERLRLGYWVMLREGSIRRDLEATLLPIIKRGLNLQRVMLVTDSMAPDDVATDGHMDFVARRAIGLGLPPVQAIQAVTLNPAAYCGLDQEIGGIAPGRWADFTLLEDLQQVRVRSVLIGGEVAAEHGRSLVRSQPIPVPGDVLKSLQLSPTVAPESFRVACSSPSAKVRVMELVSPNITAEKVLEFRPRSGLLEADPSRDLLKVAVFERHGERNKIVLGFLKGFGARVGAVGTTACLDENTLLVAGSSDRDMALCANSLIESGGGIAVMDRGEVLARIDMPVGGICSLRPWQEVAEGLGRIHRCLREKGAPFSKPIYALMFLTFVTLPALRITARGLVAAKERRVVPLLVEG